MHGSFTGTWVISLAMALSALGAPALLLILSPFLGARGEDTWWSLKPIDGGEPPAVEGITHPVDAFLQRALRREGLPASEPAAPRTLIRRVTFDLTGLPPSAEAVASFEAAPTEEAYASLVEQLLDSPHHGERWARHWLDVARYGESDGFEYNEARRNAWPYRDWVVRALNQDLPFDEFARLQLAGDILAPGADGAAAVGFLVAGVHNKVLPASDVQKRQARQEELEEIVGTVGQAFLGTTVHCARCHDHRTDPIPTEDYYRFAAALSGVFHGERTVEGSTMFTVVPREPGAMRVHVRGSAASLGEEVEPGGLSALLDAGSNFGATSTGDGERRTRLAEWVTSPRNPLFARVAVNRVWHYHFGVGLVATPNDFGRTGTSPSHPELLDWLAARFVEGGYRLKELHRLIVTSHAYRQSSRARPDGLELDPDNRLLWRANPRRLEAEAVRDAMLVVAGLLDPRMGGPGYEDTRERHFNAGRYYEPIPDGVFDRRTLYRFSPRGERDALLDAFDCPDPSTTAPRRSVTTTPLQALSLLNNPFAHRMAEGLARRVTEEADPGDELTHAWRLALARHPTEEELSLASELLRSHGLASVCLALFNSGEFVVID